MADRNFGRIFWHRLLLNTTGKKPQFFRKEVFLAMTFLVRKDNSKKKLSRKLLVLATIGPVLIPVLRGFSSLFGNSGREFFLYTWPTSRGPQKCYEFRNSYPSDGT